MSRFPKFGGLTAQALDEAARSYLYSAKVLWEQEVRVGTTHTIAPCAKCLGFGIELFLKARLLEHGVSEGELKSFGHRFHKMWRKNEFDKMREHAQHVALACVAQKKTKILDPLVCTVDWHIENLGRLFSQSPIALRYPNSPTIVPYPQPLLWVFYELLDDPRWCLASSGTDP
jgi:hypothetical protein